MTKSSANPTPQAAAIYVLELEQIEQKLNDLKKRVLKSRRAATKPDQIHWAHLGCAMTKYFRPCSSRSSTDTS